jgi:ribosomal protein S18 acetylase RimI-like enzyme
MATHQATIIAFDNAIHRQAVIDLWQAVFGYEAAHNAPEVVIDKKIDRPDGLFFVALDQQRIVGTIMAGYDGHRGWIYAIAVHPRFRKQGIGSDLLSFVQRRLASLGCLKVNLQIMADNQAVQRFYEANGYALEPRISMGKTLY